MSAARLYRSVVEELVYAALYRPELRQVALLFGSIDDEGVVVAGYTGLQETSGPFAALLDVMKDWKRIQARLGPGDVLVGWVWFEPGAAHELPPTLQIAHRTLFNLPAQVSVVVDPTRGSWCLYGASPEGNLTRASFQLIERGGATRQETPT